MAEAVVPDTSACFALLAALLIHKDPEFAAVSAEVKQRMLPPKTGPALSGTT